MAKKETKKVEVKETQFEQQSLVEETVVQEPTFEQPKARERVKPKNEWEIKDRLYILKGGKKPLSRSIKSADIYYFDEEKGYERELKYCENQRTCFVDEMKGDQRLEHIIFRGGSLYVEKEKTTLQKLLSLYHPHKDQIYYHISTHEIIIYFLINYLQYQFVELIILIFLVDVSLMDLLILIQS